MMYLEHAISFFLPSLGEIRLEYFGLLIIHRFFYLEWFLTWFFKYVLLPYVRMFKL